MHVSRNMKATQSLGDVPTPALAQLATYSVCVPISLVVVQGFFLGKQLPTNIPTYNTLVPRGSRLVNYPPG